MRPIIGTLLCVGVISNSLPLIPTNSVILPNSGHYKILGLYLRCFLPHEILREHGVFIRSLLQPEGVGHRISEAPTPVLLHHMSRMQDKGSTHSRSRSCGLNWYPHPCGRDISARSTSEPHEENE